MDKEKIKRAEQVLIDNGIEADEASIVLQAIGYVLLDAELYEEKQIKEDKELVEESSNIYQGFWDI